MKAGIPWGLVCGVVLMAFALSRTHLSQIRWPRVAEQPQEQVSKPPDAQSDSPTVTFVGPLANYVKAHTSSKPGSGQARPYKPHPSDHIGDSPVGSSRVVLHKTFAIRATQYFPFEIPAHAATPQLHGSYRSFAQAAGTAPSDESADIEFVVLNELQYQALVAGQPSNALFAAEASDSQDVNFVLPASADHPVKYYLMFRNVAGGAAKKVVQADFAVDF